MAYLTTTALANPALSYRSHAPLVSTYSLAISCLSRIGTQSALSAAIRLWNELVRTEPPFVPSEPRKKARGQQEEEEEGKEKVAKAAYAKAAYEVVRMAVMGVRERSAVRAAVKAVAGGASAFGETTASGDHGNTESSSSRGAFHPAQFPPPPSSSPARLGSSSSRSGGPAAAAAAPIPSQREAEFHLVARILHNALGRIMSGDGRPGDLSAQLGKETVAVLEGWRERIKAFLSVVDPAPTRRDSIGGRGIPARRRRNGETEEPKQTTGRDRRTGSDSRMSSEEGDAFSSARPRRSSTSPPRSSSYPARTPSSHGYGQRERSFGGGPGERWRAR